jgi:hypothetical protein
VNFSCFKCAYGIDIDLTDPYAEEKAEDEHRKFDGAHYGHFLDDQDGLTVEECRQLLGITFPESEEW